MKKISKKLVLGTANLSRTYGINRSNLKKNKSFKNILSILNKKNIFFIDTAKDYLNSEEYLGKFCLNEYKIVSKISKFKKNSNLSIEKHIVMQTKNSLSKLKIKKFYALLIHNTELLSGKNGKKIYKALNTLKKKGLVNKIGYSIYNLKELNKFYKKFKPDLIQGPFNILDQRIYRSGWLKRLNDSGVEFHARSIFLQGLLLKKPGNIPPKFRKFKDIFDNYHLWLKKNKLDPLTACLQFVYFNKFVKKVVVGVDNSNQLDDIVNLKFNTKKNYNFHKLNCVNMKLINPSKW